MVKIITHSAVFGTTFDTALGSFSGSISSGDKILDLGIRLLSNEAGAIGYNFYGVTDKINNPPTGTSTIIGAAGATVADLIGSFNGSIGAGDRITSLDVGVGTGSAGAVTEYVIIASKEGGNKSFGDTEVFADNDTTLALAVGSVASDYTNDDGITHIASDAAFNYATGSPTDFFVVCTKRRKSDPYYKEYVVNPKF